ncbi:MAG: carboxypeptidase regulatory-like domain-containing protein [Myxococcota bacterium]
MVVRSLLMCALATSVVLWPAIAVSAETGAVSGTVAAQGGVAPATTVYVEGKLPSKARPAPKKEAEIIQKAAEFSPKALVVPTGTRLHFPNQDRIFHNVYSLTPGNEFDLGLYRDGASRSAVLNRPGEVEVYCNLHPQMKAKVLVVENDFFAPIQPDGTYLLKDLPAGTYTLAVWSPEHKADRRQVVIPAKGSARVDFTLNLRSTPDTHPR